jgi:hypothetical protein
VDSTSHLHTLYCKRLVRLQVIKIFTSGIKFERHKEESLISKEPIEENKPYNFDSIILHYNESKLFITFPALHSHYKEKGTNVIQK